MDLVDKEPREGVGSDRVYFIPATTGFYGDLPGKEGSNCPFKMKNVKMKTTFRFFCIFKFNLKFALI
jgi:hypothetical protein